MVAYQISNIGNLDDIVDNLQSSATVSFIELKGQTRGFSMTQPFRRDSTMGLRGVRTEEERDRCMRLRLLTRTGFDKLQRVNGGHFWEGSEGVVGANLSDGYRSEIPSQCV